MATPTNTLDRHSGTREKAGRSRPAEAAAAPKDSAFLGPAEHSGDMWLPTDLPVIGIPLAPAERMAADADESFIGTRGRIAYPEHCVAVKPFDTTGK